jgi:geranylgeranyl pyrophosphate synthase
LYDAGINLGMLFQLTDDLLDESRESTGLSFLAAYGRKGTKQRAGQYLKRYESGVSRLQRNLEPRYASALLSLGSAVSARTET